MATNFPTPYVNNNPRPALKTGPGKTKQSFRDECDINHLMKRYAQTGTLPQGVGLARYGDFSTVEDYFDAKLMLKRAEDQFNSLPARVRDRFDNKPGLMLAFLQDKANLAEAKELGLLSDEVEVPKAEPVPPAPAP